MEYAENKLISAYLYRLHTMSTARQSSDNIYYMIKSYIEGNFYNSKEWRQLRLLKLSQNPFCELCLEKQLYTIAIDVHHLVEVKDDPELALDINNLQALCKKCHSSITYHTHLKGASVRAKSFTLYNRKYKI